MNIKMSDVAKAAGVSLATVGRVLHNNGYVSEDKRREIERIIKEMGYIPNRIAQGLKSSRSNIIGHLTLFNTNMQFKEISSAVNTAAASSGYHVLTLTSHIGLGEEEQQINDLIGHRVDGVIVTSYHSISKDLIGRLLENHIPVVMIERTFDMPMVDRIVVNDRASSLGAVQHMLQKGHRRIGFIGCKLTHQVEEDRYAGYLDALSEARITPHEEWVQVMSEYSIEAGRMAIDQLLRAGQPPTAIFMTSDIYACGVLQVLYERGLRVPDDLSLVGYDNTLSALLSPPITSVGLPFKEIGDHALQLLLQRMNDQAAISSTIGIDPFLMDRHTVREWTGD